MSDEVAPTSRPFVFLGPSLPLAEARRLLDAIYLPPVSMGDVYRLMERRPRVIAVIDGLFEQTPSVWHKEILFALSQGVRVLGASSMGALRAAELAAFGMEGVGEVFQAFHSGALEDDDEVAVAHASAADGYRSLSEAMVNMRAGLRAARDAGCIAAVCHDRLIACAKDLFYPDRSWVRVLEIGAEMGLPAGELAALRAWITRTRPNAKRDDAVQLLTQLAAERATPASEAASSACAPRRSLFDFEPTYFWQQMIADETASVGSREDDDAPAGATGSAQDAVRSVDLRRHLRVHGSRSRDALGAALLLYLADEQASRRGLAADAAVAAETGAEVEAEVALLAIADRATLDRGRRAIAALLAEVPDQVERRLPAALAHLGRLGPILDEVRRKQATLHALGLKAATLADAGLALDQLLDWYRDRFGPMTASPEVQAAELGFASVEEFVNELVLEYLADPSAIVNKL